MVIRLHNIARWAQLLPTQSIVIGGTDRHKVRIEFNAEFHTAVSLSSGDALTFLGAFVGMETIEFYAEPGSQVTATSEGQVWYDTNEEGAPDLFDPEGETFTKLLGRRTRSDQLELMLHRQKLNYERLLADQAAEYEAYIAETGVVEDDEDDTRADGGDSGAPAAEPPVAAAEPAAGQGASAAPAAGIPAGQPSAK